MHPAKLIRLTKRSIEALKPSGERYDVFDADLRGFAVRVLPSGRRTYRFKYVANQRQRVVSIGEHGAPWTCEDARTQAQILRGRVAHGEDPAAQRAAAASAHSAAALTLATLIETWLVDGRAAAPNKRDSSWTHDASRLRRHIIPLLGDIELPVLTRRQIERAQVDIVAGATAADVKTGKRGRAIVRGGRAAARAAIMSLSACLNWGVACGYLGANPAAGVKKVAAAKRERYLNEAEVLTLLQTITKMQVTGALKAPLADALRLLLLTGARKSEILELRWSEVDLERGVLKLPARRHKSGVCSGDKVVTLSAPAIDLIAARPRLGPFVFPSSRGGGHVVGVHKLWRKLMAQAGLTDVRPHDLRHTFASFAAADGASLLTIAKALGHSQTRTSERYSHLNDTSVRQLAEKVAARIMTPAAAAPTPNAATSISGRRAGAA